MKYVIFITSLILFIGCAATDWHDEHLPLADKAKSIIQFNFGMPRRVRITDSRTLEERREALELEYDEKMKAIDIKEYSRGSWMVSLGLIIAAAAIAAHIMSSLPSIKRIAEGAIVLGFGVVGAGFVQRKIVEFDTQIGCGLLLVAAVGIAYKARGWSISRLFKRKTKRAEGSDATTQMHKRKPDRRDKGGATDDTATGIGTSED